MKGDEQFIDRLEIENYKSISKLSLKTKKINIFIGEPNSGKSNILEAMFFISMNSTDYLTQVVRGKDIANLAFDSNFNDPISLRTNQLGFEIYQINNANTFNINFLKGKDVISGANFSTSIGMGIPDHNFETNIKYYTYVNLDRFNKDHRTCLSPPFGQNLPTLLLSNSNYKKIVSDIYKDKNLRLVLKPVTREIEIVKDQNDELYSYPYNTTSETLRRYAFMRLIIESNKKSIIVLDEPEANTFPFYSKMIAELIGMDNNNQYFIATHSPYLLMSLIEKTPLDDLNIVKTKMVDFETQATSIDPSLFGDMLEMGSDVFYEFDKLG